MKGLKRSIDKVYEIVVYALFSTLVDELKATVTLNLDNPDMEILEDFSIFAQYVLGVSHENPTIVRTARIFRGGVTNAADRGLDIWTNFGPTVQIKHLRLDKELADEISEEASSDNVVIVCRTADAELIRSLMSQIGKPIRGIITQDDLINWYHLCLTKYRERMGDKVLKHLGNEFKQEFPLLDNISSFFEERGYLDINLDEEWHL